MKKLLDHGYIELVEVWGSDERFIEAARMSTSKGFEGWEKDEKLLAYLYNNKHSTPFEMGGMIIEVKAPIFVFREWHRHRTQSYNEMSARYIPLPDENYIPTRQRIIDGSKTTDNKQAMGVKELDTYKIDAWLANLDQLYGEIQRVYEEGLSIGIPKELARLPVSVARYSRMRASANLRNWLAFLTLRKASAAQWEIRQYADSVGELIAEHFPRTWALFENEQNKTA
ncbi:MAG: FAD-dependent thymidylate synthase [Anaerolineales bacterium]